MKFSRLASESLFRSAVLISILPFTFIAQTELTHAADGVWTYKKVDDEIFGTIRTTASATTTYEGGEAAAYVRCESGELEFFIDVGENILPPGKDTVNSIVVYGKNDPSPMAWNVSKSGNEIFFISRYSSTIPPFYADSDWFVRRIYEGRNLAILLKVDHNYKIIFELNNFSFNVNKVLSDCGFVPVQQEVGVNMLGNRNNRLSTDSRKRSDPRKTPSSQAGVGGPDKTPWKTLQIQRGRTVWIRLESEDCMEFETLNAPDGNLEVHEYTSPTRFYNDIMVSGGFSGPKQKLEFTDRLGRPSAMRFRSWKKQSGECRETP